MHVTSGGLQLRHDHVRRPLDATPRGKQSKFSKDILPLFTLMMYKLLLMCHPDFCPQLVIYDSKFKFKKKNSKVGPKTIVNEESVWV